ncbi:Uncharacterised protein [uncultured archaeon]|nr:Uncharacterised protein [uncultured archaeon]
MLGEDKKIKAAEVASLPEGLKELLDVPKGERQAEAMLLPGEQRLQLQIPAAEAAAALPQHASAESAAQAIALPPPEASKSAQAAREQPLRPKTQKEQELDSLIALRQGIIEKLKARNPQVVEARRKIAEMVPAIRGSGASHTMRLAAEAEHIEFSIATEAYTPKKEKELIKRLRDIRQELSKHKEIDDARKAVDAERHRLHELFSDVRSLEHELDDARKKCDAAYGEVLAERKAAYETRQKGREERKQKQFEELKTRVREERRKQYDDEIKPYMKNYDDTVSMDEIVEIEKKGKKEEKEGS